VSVVDGSILSSILYEFGQVDSAKEFWNALEMKYSKRMSGISPSQEYVEHSTEREPSISTGEEIFISEAKDTPRFDELKFIEEWIAKPKIVEDCIEIATKENKDDKPKHEDLCPKNLNNGDCNEEPVIVIVYGDSEDPTRQIFENEYEE
jgi:hypothetical protein